MDYQWYPGHMTKAKRMMQENVRLVDLVIEILDARVPLSGRNPDVDQLAQGKQRMIILSKADLADPELTAEYVNYFTKKKIEAIALDARTRKANTQVMKALSKITKEKKERDQKRGIRNRPVRAMICGIPNVGKSTFINSLSGRSSAKTGNKPGVTKGKQWISFAGLELLDTPGILWPKFEDQNVGVRLALVGSIRDEILDEEDLARRLLEILLRRYPSLLRDRYFVSDDAKDAVEIPEQSEYNDRELHEILVQIAAVRNLLRSGAEPDPVRAAHLLLDDFRSGRIGRITLDELPEAANETEE
ncbi:MAG: ribosome biogenesis GTPase YlqF [Lachnospiraceae bacterium]|nr:ribosome biogenesis GTPase YlqF [Bacillota bacterium]MCI6594048.1 ribosome biogenesis GTPase YlqF [Bacillota bacterium]MDY2949478.1 ribosome biogenesis GTPase YlqF [Lachnospiraceae bacterium]